MTDKIAEIRARHSQDERWHNGPSMLCPQSHDDRATLLIEIERLREAMQFYADPNRYKSTSVHMCGHSTGQSVMIDGGRKAREALGVKS